MSGGSRARIVYDGAMRDRRAWLVIVLLVWLAGVCGIAAADTGGRMGGGSWGSKSSSSSSSSSGGSRSYSSGGSRSYSSSRSSSSSSSRSSSSSYGGTSSSSYSGGGGGGAATDVGFLIVLVAGGLVAAVIFAVKHTQDANQSYNYSSFVPSYVPFDGVDVSVLRVAVDGRARKFIQAELARIAASATTATEEGRLLMLREVSLLLRRVRDAWVYGGAVNEPMREIGAAKVAFDKHVDDARARFARETISNVQGQRHLTDGGAYTPRSDEGEGIILVSIIVAARSELFTVAKIGDGEDIRKALEASSNRAASDLVAIEIVWQPSEENDRMSSIELAAKYPRPELIPISNALVGKTFCAYCSGPFPAELVSCPHCGAPAREERPEPRAA